MNKITIDKDTFMDKASDVVAFVVNEGLKTAKTDDDVKNVADTTFMCLVVLSKLTTALFGKEDETV